MRWVRRLLITISLATVLIAVAIILLFTIDLGRFKGNVEEYVTNLVDRQFVIAGSFRPSIGKTITLIAEDVRLANADWGKADNILEMERLVVTVDTWSLLSGLPEVMELEVEGLTLHVEKDPETRRSSWSFRDSAAGPNDDESGQPFEMPILLERARLKNINITYGQGWLDAPRELTINDASFFADDSELLRMVLSGAIGGESIGADGLVGPLSTLLDGHGPRWELNVTIGDFLASTHGAFDELFTLEGPEIHVLMQGPLAERILSRFGLPPLAHGPVDITADLVEGSQGIDLRVDGAFGDLTTQIVGHAESFRTISNLDLSIDVHGSDIKAVGELFDAGFLPSAEFVVNGGLSSDDDTLNIDSIIVSVGDARLEVSGKLTSLTDDPDAQLTLSASGPEIDEFLPEPLVDRVPSGAFDIRAVAAGDLQNPELRNLDAQFGEHELSVDGILPVAADMSKLDITVAARGPDLGDLIGPWVKRDIAMEPYSGGARIRNTGAGFIVDDLNFDLGSASIKAAGTSRTLTTLAGLNASFTLGGEDLQTLLEPWLDITVPTGPFSVDGTLVAADGALQLSNVTYRFGDVRGTLDGTTGILPSLVGLRMNTSTYGSNVRQFGEALGGLDNNVMLPEAAFEVHSSITKSVDGRIMEQWAIDIGESTLELSGALGRFDGTGIVDLNFAASGPDLRRFLPDRGIELPLAYEVNGGVRIGDDKIEWNEVDIRVGETSAWFDGSLPLSTQMTNVEFDFRIAGPNLQLTAQAFDIPNLAPDAFRLQGGLTRAGSTYSIHSLNATVGENDLSGDISLQMGDRIQVTGRLNSKHLNLTKLYARYATSAESDDDAPGRDLIIPDTTLPFQILDVADVDLALRMRNLRTDSLDVGDVEFKIVIKDDELHVEMEHVTLKNGGTMRAAFDLHRTSDDQADVQVSIDGKQFNMRPMIDIDGHPIERPPEDATLELAGSGTTIRDLAASANGSISLRQGMGYIDNDFGKFMMHDMLSQIFASISPTAADSKYTRLECGFLEADVRNGIVRSRAIGLQTDKLGVASVGKIDLATEALDLSFRVKPREGLGISFGGVVHPFFKVGGTLASPAMEFDMKRGLFTGTFAVLTGGLSILAQGVWDRHLSQDDYCEAIIDALDSGEIPVWDGS